MSTACDVGRLEITKATRPLICALPAVRNALGKLASILMEMEEERHVQEFIDRGVTVEMIKEIDADNSGEVDKLEFLCYMLVGGHS